MPWNFDDKDLAILALTVIALAVIFNVDNPQDIIIAIVSAIAGFASGRALNNGNQQK